MPDDYYVSQYSGEEIDERLTAAHNAVRYDAAQTLTDSQKTQSRKNIAAAPDGFGLGLQNVILTSSDDLDNVKGNGWYLWRSSTPANAPDLINVNTSPIYCDMFMIDESQIVVSNNDRNNMAMRTSNIAGWIPWEYINPPLKLGVEYRTTERYLGKPVYVKKVDFGNAPAVSIKEVSCATNVANVVDFNLTVWNGVYAQENIIINDDGTLVARPYSKLSEGTLSIALAVFEDISTRTVDLVVKYTKTTD